MSLKERGLEVQAGNDLARRKSPALKRGLSLLMTNYPDQIFRLK